MHTVTDAFNSACSAPGREITSKVNFNGTTDLPASEIQEIVVTEQFGSSDGVTIGAAFSSSCKVTMYKQDNLPLNGAYFIPSVGIMVGGEAQYVQKGKYYIPTDGVEDSGKLWVTVTGYDRMAGLTEDYVPTIDFPATPTQILADVCTQGNVTAPSVTLPDIQIAAPYTGTLRQQLGWLAGLIGCNAKFDSAGNLVFCWYADSGLTIGLDVQYMGGLSLTADEAFTIHSLLTGTENNPISVGAGIGIKAINPYITPEVSETVFATLDGKTMMPCKVKWRGNPAVEAGDIVGVIDSGGNALNVYVMEQTLYVKGGMYAETTCYAPADTDYSAASPTEQKFQRMYSDVIKSFQEATQKIIGAKGGYFEITYDDDGYPTGWTLKNTPTVEANTKMWIMSIGGLGFSADGGKTISKVALTMDGAIDGSSLAIGSVSQDAVSGLSQEFTAINGKLESKISSEEVAKDYATKKELEEIELTPGPAGASVYITYHDGTATPATPTGDGTKNGWHTDLTADVVWMSQKVAASATDGTWGAPIRILGQDGTKGDPGNDGVSVSATTVEYYLSTSYTELSGGTWQVTAPTITDGKYLWSRTNITYSNGQTAYTGAYCISKAMTESAEPIVSGIRKAMTKLTQDVDSFKATVSETYTEKSNFNEFKQKTESDLTANSTAIEQRYTEIKTVEQQVLGVDGKVTDVQKKVTETAGYIRTGKVAEDASGNPIYGVKIGQTDTAGNYNAFAQFTAGRISFFDETGKEISHFAGKDFYIDSGIIVQNLNLGGYELRRNKGLGFKWIGG